MRSSWLIRSAVVAAAGLAALTPATAFATTVDDDPRGANGTIKIDASPDGAADSTDNEPHAPCVFEVEFFGFDEGQVGGLTFTAHSPTGEGETLLTDRREISDDPAGGGQDGDAAVTYDLTAALAAYEPHPQQGYHVKLTVELYNADGTAVPNDDGTTVAKHKVFWIEPCAEEGASGEAGGETGSGTGSGDTTGESDTAGEAAGGGAGAGEGQDTGTGTGGGDAVAGDVAGGGTAAGGTGDTAVKGTKVGQPSQDSAAARAVGGVLAATGGGNALGIGLLGAAVLVGGAVLTVLARRRTAGDD